MTTPIEPIIIGLGGNIGSEVAITARFQRVRDALAELGELRAAPLYRSAPIGPAQDPYLNSALWLRVDLEPVALLAVMQELEHLLGRDRDREVRWGPRLIDLDLLVWGQRVIRTPELVV
ncbi:MAG: 2-amino-4-hydroxy-6-hydroxymethyldihydropteridine diphosphokinase, partial [Myxococcota bacterium]|nr:2-amino-4-hydroxy-6-hydroxymethyldihydropteridine diphosphokinase [Myxococcota bacterium]